MCLEVIIKRAQGFMTEHCAEHAFITGNDAMVCLGILKDTPRRSELYLEMPQICRRLIEGQCTLPDKPRFKSSLKLKNVTAVYVTSSLIDLRESGRFVYIGAGLWVETMESYLRDNDADFLTYVQDHVRKISTE